MYLENGIPAQYFGRISMVHSAGSWRTFHIAITITGILRRDHSGLELSREHSPSDWLKKDKMFDFWAQPHVVQLLFFPHSCRILIYRASVIALLCDTDLSYLRDCLSCTILSIVLLILTRYTILIYRIYCVDTILFVTSCLSRSLKLSSCVYVFFTENSKSFISKWDE